ncbi:MAG: HlyD family efflux transporter periplasmic adaptor subunit [Bryobacteraceae bacterium]|jgi:multidrug resistance efflux pump
MLNLALLCLLAQDLSIRSTGTIRAVNVFNVLVPTIRGSNVQLTVTKIIANGSLVKEGDIIAEFDRTKQFDDARDAKAKMDDLGHQLEQQRAQYRSDAAKRESDLKGAEAAFEKAEIELRKGEVLSEIDRLKNEAIVESARARVESLKKSSHFHDLDEAAGLRILELQRNRQEMVLERTKSNAEKLTVRAPISGMAALDNVWRNGSIGPFQEGDQAYSGQSMIKLFDPTDMLVITQINEPDGAVLARAGARAKIRLDAYPGVVFEAHFESASPVASAGLNSPIKYFTARFKIDQRDPRLLPDLSAAVEIEAGK